MNEIYMNNLSGPCNIIYRPFLKINSLINLNNGYLKKYQWQNALNEKKIIHIIMVFR